MKYSPEELREMARVALEARDAGDFRWNFLCLELAVRLGLHPNEVATRIEQLCPRGTTHEVETK